MTKGRQIVSGNALNNDTDPEEENINNLPIRIYMNFGLIIF